MFTDSDRQKYIACQEWVRRGLGTPDQLARYRAYIATFEANQATVDNPPAQHTLFDQADPQPVTPQAEDTPGHPETVKVWAMVGLHAIGGNHGGGWRFWALAHTLDTQGSGWVWRSDLWGWLSHLGVGDRQRRRWLRDAINTGLVREAGDRYYLTGLSRAAVILGCQQVGRPAEVSAAGLVGKGWRAVVWGAYIATLNGRPMSQETKHRLTGVDPRTQRNYQAAIPGEARRNYAKTNTPGDHVDGIRDNGRGAAFVGRDGKLVYRLPDIRIVPSGLARLTPKGRSRKAQKQVNACLPRGGHSDRFLRLFHDTANGVKATLRQISRADLPPWETPGELFELSHAGRSVNLWQPVAVGGINP